MTDAVVIDTDGNVHGDLGMPRGAAGGKEGTR